jgi:hypothetical protein
MIRHYLGAGPSGPIRILARVEYGRRRERADDGAGRPGVRLSAGLAAAWPQLAHPVMQALARDPLTVRGTQS